MPLPLNEEMLAAAYEYLSASKPFDKWNLPHSEEVKFRVFKRKDRYADYRYRNGRHHINISSVLVGSHMTLLATMAHEILHLHLNATGCIDMRAPHGVGFNKLADQVCRVHAFDRLIF